MGTLICISIAIILQYITLIYLLYNHTKYKVAKFIVINILILGTALSLCIFRL